LRVDGPAPEHLVVAGDINYIDDEEAQNILEDTLKPQKYDPLEFWNHIQSQVSCMTYHSVQVSAGKIMEWNIT